MSRKASMRVRQASHVRPVLVDSASVVMGVDPVGAIVKIMFTKGNVEIVSEEFEVDEKGNQIPGLIANPQYTTVKDIELIAEMRPDHALTVSDAIRKAVGDLPNEIKAKYNIKI